MAPRRIAPIAVEAPSAAAADAAVQEAPLDVGPAPDQGDPRAVHPKLGAGRRFWVDIQDSYELKFKQVVVVVTWMCRLQGCWAGRPSSFVARQQ